jgi:hypothetical protein
MDSFGSYGTTYIDWNIIQAKLLLIGLNKSPKLDIHCIPYT